MRTSYMFSKGIWRFVIAALFLLAMTASGIAQDTNASLSGTVTDPSGAAIPNAKLTLTNEAMGFQSSFVSDENGNYSFRNLTPGKYSLSASAGGFKTQDQKGIELAVNQAARVDVHLPVGQTGETVTVVSDASLINYENQTLEGGVAPETLQSFPLTVNGAPRSSVAVATLMPGVTTAGSNNAFNARINGGLVTGDEAVVDGATAIEGYMNQSGMVSLLTDFGMSPDITSEVKVLTANYDAQFGDSTSGQLIIQTQSGGEQFHGGGYEYLRNDMFNAFAYGASPNDDGKFIKPADKENDYGAYIGGPIYLPKLHGNSWAKGYFYFNWERFQDHGGANPPTLSIASLNARQGNFSAISSQLWYPNDPAKYGPDAGKAIAYQGVKNQIDPKYADPVSAGFMSLLPNPTNTGNTSNYLVPHAGQGSLTNSENVYFWRVDFTLGKKDHLYYTYWWQYAGVNLQTDLPIALSTAKPANPENAPIQRLNWEHTFSDVMTNHLTLGYLNRNEGYYALNGKSDLPRVPGVADATFNPNMSIDGYDALGSNGVPDSSLAKTTRGTYALNEVLTRIMGRHTFKAGFEYRLAGTAIHLGENQGGTFSFSKNTTSNSVTNDPGDAMASFYLGAVSTANVDFYNIKAEYPRQPAWAFHVGDSWKLSPKFTLNYSLRWDYIAPFKEKYNHLSFIDPLGGNPAAIGPDGKALKGRLAFAGNKYGEASYGKDFPEIPFKKGFAPRVGFAYALNDKTVVRAGYGIYFGQAFYPGWDGGMSLEGFNKNVNISETTSGINKLPVIYLNSGLSANQVGETQNVASDFENGKSPAKYRPLDGNRRPYSQQWNLTVERQLPHNFFAAVSYVGTKGDRLPSALAPINILNPLDTAITSIGSDLTVDYNSPEGPAAFSAHNIRVPYSGWETKFSAANGAACAPTIAQALLPYPQFCSEMQGQNEGHGASRYNSLQARVERHLTSGLYVLGSLTVAKLYTDASDSTQSTATHGEGTQGNNGQFSPYALFPRAWALAPDNVPITLQLASVYDLPFGRNKAFLNRGGFSNLIVGGWQVSPLWRYEYGTPFSFYSSNCITSQNYGYFREGCVPAVKHGVKVQPHGRNGFNPATATDYFNLNAFEPASAFNTPFYTGTGKAVTDIYGPSYKNLDIAFTKITRISEKVSFRFESNFFNAFNNHYLLASQGGNYGGQSVAFVTDIGTTSTDNPFGSWNHNTTPPRTIQFAGRIEF
jgi:hypothetical protein